MTRVIISLPQPKLLGLRVWPGQPAGRFAFVPGSSEWSESSSSGSSAREVLDLRVQPGVVVALHCQLLFELADRLAPHRPPHRKELSFLSGVEKEKSAQKSKNDFRRFGTMSKPTGSDLFYFILRTAPSVKPPRLQKSRSRGCALPRTGAARRGPAKCRRACS